MIPTTEIELNEKNDENTAKKGKPGAALKNKASEVYSDFRKSYKQANFTPVALRPVDRNVCKGEKGRF